MAQLESCDNDITNNKPDETRDLKQEIVHLKAIARKHGSAVSSYNTYNSCSETMK